MNFSETILAVESTLDELDKDMKLIHIFNVNSFREYENNLKEAELKVESESGTFSDLLYLREAANEGFIVRTKNAIKKLIESFKKAVKTVAEKISSFFNKDETKKTLDKAEKAAKTIPEVKSLKVEIINGKEYVKICQKYNDKIDKKIALINAGKVDKNTLDELEKIEEDFEKEVENLLKATISVSILTALTLMALLSKEVDNTSKMDFNFKPIDENTSVDVVGAMVNAQSIKAKINKENAMTLSKIINQIFTAIKQAIAGEGAVDLKDFKLEHAAFESVIIRLESVDKPVSENSHCDEEYLDELLRTVEESTEGDTDVALESGDDIDLLLESMEDEILRENGNRFYVEESTVESNELNEYLESLEDEVLQEHDELSEILESIENDIDSDYFTNEDDDEMTEGLDPEEFDAEDYLVSLESELGIQNEDDESVVESEKDYDAMLEELESSL